MARPALARMASDIRRIFTIDIDGKPTIIFVAERLSEARELCNEEWFLEDLCKIMSNGMPVYTRRSKLKPRTAVSVERAAYDKGAREDAHAGDLLLVYLVELDARQNDVPSLNQVDNEGGQKLPSVSKVSK